MLQAVKTQTIYWCPSCGSVTCNGEERAPTTISPCNDHQWNPVGILPQGQVEITAHINVPEQKTPLGHATMGIPCTLCGSLLIRSGTCGVCPDCGTSGGCS